MIAAEATHPSSAKVALLVETGRPLLATEVPMPTPSAGEVLVRIDACAVCGSDLHTAHGRRPHALPAVLGHEIAGTIVALGPDQPPVDIVGVPLRIGDRVTWSVCASCGTCDRCAAGLPQKCRSLFKYGHADADTHPLAGGFADHILLRRKTAVVRLPESLSAMAAAPASCAVATAAAALRSAGPINGRSVVVLGAGMLGLSAASLAAGAGAAQVLVVDPRGERLDRVGVAAPSAITRQWDDDADALEHAVSAVTGGDGADVVIEAGGTRESVGMAVRLVATGGICVLAGAVVPLGDVPFDPERLVRRLASIRGVHNYRPEDLAMAVAHLASPAGVGLAALVGPVMPLAAINDALALAASGAAVRVVVAP